MKNRRRKSFKKRIEPVIVTEITINRDKRVESENLIVRKDSQLSNNSE